jgi:hypothetical protein
MKAIALLSVLPLLVVSLLAGPASGPLRVHPDNPRYFADASGEAVLLTGSHTWNTIVDMSPSDPPAAFDFPAFLDWAAGYGHNFIRLWTWELTTWSTEGNSPSNRVRVQVHHVAPHPWLRTGPGTALDGKPKFDLTKLNPEYLERIRSRAKAAGQRGFYTSVMLFEGWGIRKSPNAWKHHPMNPANNVNGVDADTNRDGEGLEIHRLGNRAVMRLQEEVVRQVVDTVNGLDNVLFEIANEAHPDSTEWQYHMIDFVHEYERSMPKQHPVGMTYQQTGGLNSHLFSSPADWISPGKAEYRNALFRADGSKVILNDTDHLWGIGGTVEWAWKSFLQGMNPLFMDPYDGVVLGNRFDPRFEPVRRAMGQIARLSRELELAAMRPRSEIVSTGYCLGAPGRSYVAYAGAEGTLTIDLSGEAAEYTARWINPETGAVEPAGTIAGGGRHEFAARSGGVSILHLQAR